MFLNEALWIRDALALHAPRRGGTALDVGSSTERFRCLEQPHIDYFVLRPLRDRGMRVVHLDGKHDRGVDIVCDLAADSAGGKKPRVPVSDVLLCTNLLAHVTDRARVLARIVEWTRPGGLLLVTVPHRFRVHPDPIDTRYRPTNTALEALFDPSRFRVEASALIEGEEEPEVDAPLWKRVLNLPFRVVGGAPPFPYRVTKNLVACVAIRKLGRAESRA